MKEYISGEKLAQYLHVSKKKMRYLLQNGYIPMYDTEKKTHRYQVKLADAEEFKKKMESNPNMLCHLKGLFSNKPHESVVSPSIDSSKAFEDFLTKKWVGVPVALHTREAGQLIGFDYRRINEYCKSGKLQSITMNRMWICTKQSFIAFCASEGMMARPKQTQAYYDLITEFANK